MKHGRPSGYNQGCRCRWCRRANTMRQRERREHIRANQRKLIDGRWVSTSSLAIHGTLNAYGNWHCRCVPCCEAHSIKLQANRAQRMMRRDAQT